MCISVGWYTCTCRACVIDLLEPGTVWCQLLHDVYKLSPFSFMPALYSTFHFSGFLVYSPLPFLCLVMLTLFVSELYKNCLPTNYYTVWCFFTSFLSFMHVRSPVYKLCNCKCPVQFCGPKLLFVCGNVISYASLNFSPYQVLYQWQFMMICTCTCTMYVSNYVTGSPIDC